MKKEMYGIVNVTKQGLRVFEIGSNADITNMFRDDMIALAAQNLEALKFNPDTNRAKRIPMSDLPNESATSPADAPNQVNDPVLALINRAHEIKPADLAGCGKTQAAKSLPAATGRPFFYFNLGATQDPRSTLIGNTHFKDGQTTFDESAFVKAIQTENAVILLDELSRAHPEAWNILMTVLDEGQRYLRLDEDINAPTIHVASGVSFIATANSGTEYTSTRVIDRAIMDRFEIIEVDILSMQQEKSLLKYKFGNRVSDDLIHAVADIADATRKEWRSEEGKLSTMISTRMTVRVCDLLADEFTLLEASEVAILPFFDAAGGADSERTYVKQIIQKHMATAETDIFNTQSTDPDAMPF